MYLLVWLWNPGSEYSQTRHNAGFILADMLAKDFAIDMKIDKDAKIGKWYIYDQEVILLEPLTYMNLSGWPVARISQFYKIPHDHIIVLHDEIDIPNAQIRYKYDWSTAWHNGLKDISLKLWTNAYHRIRLWVGRSANPNISVSDWVLWKFRSEELSDLTGQYIHICQLIEKILKNQKI